MKGYLVISWNPWDCQDVYKKVFLDKKDLYCYLISYELNKKKDETLDIHEVEIGE